MGEEPLRVWLGRRPAVDITDRHQRLALAPIARADIDVRGGPKAQAERYGSLLDGYRIVDDPGEAEVALVPNLIEHSEQSEVARLVASADRQGLRTVVFSGHDFEPILPWDSAILLHPGPTRGAQPHAAALAVPYFFTDRAQLSEPRPAGERPSIAFCGQGLVRRRSRLGQAGRRSWQVASHRVRPKVVPPPLGGHVALRARALRALAAHPDVEDHFIVRDQYRAGALGDAGRARSQREFDDNLRSATYALCVRGSGNFSARLYEALSFGRIPVIVATDGVLPLEDILDWSSVAVTVPASDVDRIGDRLLSAHHDGDGGSRSQLAVRSFWEKNLTSEGFFSQLVPILRAHA